MTSLTETQPTNPTGETYSKTCFRDVPASASLLCVVSQLINEVEYFIPTLHDFFIISDITVNNSREGKNIEYFSDSIQMWRLIMQHNPSILVSLCP